MGHSPDTQEQIQAKDHKENDTQEGRKLWAVS